MFDKHLLNEKGMVIPIVLMVFMVLMIIGGAALSVATADHRHSAHQSHKIQAYYLAKSGAEAFADYLIEKSSSENFSTMNNLLNTISNKTSESANFKDGNITITVNRRTEGAQEKLDIISMGTYKGISETVSVTLLISTQAGGGDFNPSTEEKALVVLSDGSEEVLQLLGGAYLNGDVIINATSENSIVFRGGSGYNIRNGALYIPYASDPNFVISTDRGSSNGDAGDYKIEGIPDWQWFNNWAFWRNIEDGVKFLTVPSPSSNYPTPIFPVFPNSSDLPVPVNPNYETPWKEDLYYPILEDGYYNSIRPSSSRTITIDLAYGNRIIRVRNLDLSGGNIDLINIGEDSKLILYVDNYFDIGSSRSLNGNGIPDNVYIYYAGTQKVRIDGAARFSGNIFVRDAELELTAGANFKGNITSLGTKVSITGGSAANDMILYAPYAHVEMGGSAQIKGSVISKTFIRSGGGNAGIIYTPTSYSIPGDFFESTDNNLSIKYDVNPWK